MVPGTFKNKFFFIAFTVGMLLSCQAKRTGVVYELTSYQKKHGVVREIQCATAHSVYAWDVEDVGVSSKPIGKPIAARAKLRFLTPLTKENYFEVCDDAAARSSDLAEKKIQKLGGNKETHTIKEESVYPSESEKQSDVRWVKDDRYKKYLRDGTCRCRDQKVETLKRSVFCTQEYSFTLEGGNEGQKCYGYFTKAVPNIAANELVAITQRAYCEKQTTEWVNDCAKNQDVYKNSKYFLAKGFKPLGCQTQHDEFFHPCECSTDVMNLIPLQGARFFCTRMFDQEEIILDINTTGGN